MNQETSETSIAKIDEATKALESVKTIPEVMKWRSMAQGFIVAITKEYREALNMRDGTDDKNLAYESALKAGEFRLKVEARLGELIQLAQKEGTLASQDSGKPRKCRTIATLSYYGLTRADSSRAQKIADHKELIPQVVTSATKAKDIPTKQTIFKAIKQETGNTDKSRKSPELIKQYDVGIRHGDFREVLNDITPQSVKLIFTDPPYGKKYLPLWEDLGIFAARVLRSDGALITYSGQLYLPQVINALSKHLDWWWLCGLTHEGTGNFTPLGQPARKVINQFKPILLFVAKGGGINVVFRDLIKGQGKNKDMHNWQQALPEAKTVLKTFCKEKETDLVIDPFAGSGTIGKAALELNLQFIGAEILDNGE